MNIVAENAGTVTGTGGAINITAGASYSSTGSRAGAGITMTSGQPY